MDKSVFALLLVVSSAVGCLRPGYRPQGINGGYSDTRLAEDTFRVDYRGSEYTSSAQASDFATLRASELCIRAGYLYFVPLSASSRQQQSAWGATPENSSVRRPESQITLRCVRAKPETAGFVDVQLARSEICSKYRIRQCPSTSADLFAGSAQRNPAALPAGGNPQSVSNNNIMGQ